MQVEEAADLPRTKSHLKEEIRVAEERLRGLRALQPDAARFASLESTELAESRTQQQRLKTRAAQESAQAEQLQNQHAELQSRVQVPGPLNQTAAGKYWRV